MLVVVLLAIVVVIILLYQNREYFAPTSDPCTKECVDVHKTYPWLNHINGGLNKIQYMEPPSSGIWRDYTDEIWEIHCKVIDHHPEQLVESHVKAFIDEKTRFAKLKFIFKNGIETEASKTFYELEADYFKNKLC